MNALRMANAIVHFRMLRSLGCFTPTCRSGVYQFCPGCRGRSSMELLPNGLPEIVNALKIKQIIDDYSVELGMLCSQHYT